MSTANPAIHFFTDSNGHNVAYAVQGPREPSESAPWLVCPAWWVSHLERDWEHEPFRELFCGLAEHFNVVRFDRPGTGLSDRQRSHFSLQAETDTLISLLDHLAIEAMRIAGQFLRRAACHSIQRGKPPAGIQAGICGFLRQWPAPGQCADAASDV